MVDHLARIAAGMAGSVAAHEWAADTATLVPVAAASAVADVRAAGLVVVAALAEAVDLVAVAALAVADAPAADSVVVVDLVVVVAAEEAASAAEAVAAVVAALAVDTAEAAVTAKLKDRKSPSASAGGLFICLERRVYEPLCFASSARRSAMRSAAAG
jgi:hypothetical protein